MSASTGTLETITASHIEALYTHKSAEMHKKVDETRDAYLGFIFPASQHDLLTVSAALGLSATATRALYKAARGFSSFRPEGPQVRVTNHIYGASILALREKSLDTGLASVTDQNLRELVVAHDEAILEIAESRASWFGKIYFPAVAFANAISVFGGKVSEDSVYDVASQYQFAAMAGKRKTVRGDFGIAVWLTMLAKAP